MAVAFGAIVLITGPLWAAKAWGRYWTWDPRLTTALLSVLIYVAYVVLRSFAGDGEASGSSPRRSASSAPRTCRSSTTACRSGAASTPRSSARGAVGRQEMYPALFLSLGAFTLLAAVLLWARTRLEISRARLRQLEDEALAVLP